MHSNQQMCGCNDFLRSPFPNSSIHSLTNFTALTHRETKCRERVA
jgi:hypothetical protein